MTGFEETIRELVRSEVARMLPELVKVPPTGGEYLNTKQVAEMTGLSVTFFEMGRSMEAADHPPYHRVGRRVLYKREDVVRWLAERRRGGRS